MLDARKRRDHAKRTRQPLVLEVLEVRTLPSVAPTTVLDLYGLAVNPNQFSSTDILVRFQTTPGTTGGPALATGTSLGSALPLESNTYQVNLGKGMTVAKALAVYKAERGVLDAEPDYDLTVSEVPNDPLLSQQWSLNNTGQNGGTPGADIHAEQAWDVTTGSPGIVVAVMDTGIDYDSPDLYENIRINQAEIPDYWYTKSGPTSGYDKIVYKWQIKTATPGVITFRDLNNPVNAGLVWDNNGDGRIDAGDLLRPLSQGGWDKGSTQDGDTAHPDDLIGWNFVNNTNNPMDDNGHGTNVAGILGATGDNGTGVAGVDWNVPIMPIKFLGSNGVGTVSSFIQGLNYAVQHGAKITNNSWEGAPYSQALYDAIQNAQQHGQIFVAAAGNEGANDDQTPDYPASFSQSLNNVVAVAATDDNDQLASFSNYGAHSVALAAPGVNILSTLPGGSYGVMSGTSMATPEVTGALALVWGEHPDWTYTQVIDQVLNTVDRLPGLQGKVSTGGRLDLAAAVGWNLSTRTTPIVTSVTAQGPTPDSKTMDSLWLTFNEPIDVSTFASSSVRLTDPSGRVIPVIVRVVWNSGDRQMALIFPNQTAPGNYQLSINSSVQDLMGIKLVPYQTTIAVNGPQTYTNSTAAAINPQSTTSSTLTVPQGVTVGRVQLQIHVSYPDDGDLYIRLTAPNGTTVLLVDRRGGTGANFYYTNFNDQAPAIAYGTAPYAGTYQPESLLSALNGSPAGGVWKLTIQDVGGHSGQLLGWSLQIDPADPAPSVVKTSGTGAPSFSPAATPAPVGRSGSAPPGGAAQVSGQTAAGGHVVPITAVPNSGMESGTPVFSRPSDRISASLSRVARFLTGLLVGKRQPNESPSA
jgi:subtilisin family serine protease/subtilisin-like proprotein convertase family protein